MSRHAIFAAAAPTIVRAATSAWCAEPAPATAPQRPPVDDLKQFEQDRTDNYAGQLETYLRSR